MHERGPFNQCRGTNMSDLIYAGVMIAFFAACASCLRGCEKL